MWFLVFTVLKQHEASFQFSLELLPDRVIVPTKTANSEEYPEKLFLEADVKTTKYSFTSIVLDWKQVSQKTGRLHSLFVGYRKGSNAVKFA